MIDFNTIQKKAAEQLTKDWNELQDTLRKDQSNESLCQALLRLRKLNENSRFSLRSILCGGVEPSFLDFFEDIINPKEFLKLPGSLDSLITLLRYNILDDGYLSLARIEVTETDDLDEIFSRKVVKYFLISDEKADPMELAENKICHESFGLVNLALTSVKMTWFRMIEKFTKFLEIMGRKKSWKSFDFIASDEVDKLMNFYEVENLLKAQVNSKEMNTNKND